MDTKLKELDLNLLKILQAVVETQNSHAAAEKLKISQASVSRGMARLRESFGDQLFIRKAHGVEPSELAKKMAEAACEMLNPLLKVLDTYQDFNPEDFDGNITILVNTFLLEFFGPSLIMQLKRSLPHASFNIAQWQKDSLYEVLQGNIDYVLQFASYSMPQEVYCRNLAQIENVVLARKAHPVLTLSSEWERIHGLPIVRLFLDGINPKRGILDKIYEQQGYKANFVLTTHSVRTAVELVKNTDAIMYSSEYVKDIAPEIEAYSLPPLTKRYNQLDINGAYLQTRRGNPVNQYLHQVLQSFFDKAVYPITKEQ
ncbi:LysR family transcriptional regulator [Photobacterium sp. SDRW27]|uniref:LysR family transcriptional regulator n=1 Tax=Photobacterium obscurum TaxID=2829490 RepID=UPI0022437496|nr:LysR family transcriptional regulator [Photobacterium obscurum]MCW8329269.1 LysR family transcriptional regulator [Photobacterium obscurum]